MNIFFQVNGQQKNELALPEVPGGNQICFSENLPGSREIGGNDIFFLLNTDLQAHVFNQFLQKPVIINSVTDTLEELNTPENVVRINGWSGFLQRPVWEVAGILQPAIQKACEILNKKIISVPDTPGLVAARVLAMIINEAWYTFKEGVSSQKEIDLAMKLGTGYPLGPFEWGRKIGFANIYHLLKKLSSKEARYIPSFIPEEVE